MNGDMHIFKHHSRVYLVDNDKWTRYDLTAMFGRKNANAINTIERAFPGRGIAVFESLFPENYQFQVK